MKSGKDNVTCNNAKNGRRIILEMLTYKLALYVLILPLGLSACRHNKPAEPMCRLASKHIESKITRDMVKQSGCLIRLNDKLLSVQYSQSEKLDLPLGDIRHDESAQCAAHRHTWKTTGFNVEVGKYLGKDETETEYYQCTPAGDFTGEWQIFPVPEWADGKVASIEFIDPFVTQDNAWQGTNRLVLLRDMFNQIKE